MEDLCGRIIKGYEFQEFVAAGGFGSIYRAYQKAVGREVAIKVILPRFANLPDFIRRFEKEAHLVARLEHPHIVPLYDYWREADSAFIVMRWFPHGNLRKEMEKGALPLEAVATLLGQVASALNVAHHNGVIHRDLKPDNILLDGECNYYLTDFGIAKDLIGDMDISTGGQVTGTPAYLSPEQGMGKTVTSQSDIYSLGVVLFELLTGNHPFPEADPTTQILHHINDPLPSILRVNPELPKQLDEVIQKATAKPPEERYDTVMEIVAAFQQALKGELAEEDLLYEPPDGVYINPYKGLRAFEEADGNDFFGREALVEQLIKKMGGDGENDHFIALVGPSGSGKSSTVKAGLIPALRKGAIPVAEKWFIASMQPGLHPLDELEVELLSIASDRSVHVREQLDRDGRGLVRAAQLLLPNDQSELLLVIDQFEELFLLLEDEEERCHFLELLQTAALDRRSRVRVLVTLRADFFDRPLMYPGFCELMRDNTTVILPLSTEELARAIVQPAKRAGISIETDLVTELVSEVVDQPGALPMLQYALTEMFEAREKGKITRKSYELVGGVMGALGGSAEKLYQSLGNEKREVARQVFLRLVTLGEGTDDTRRRVIQNELEGISKISKHVRDVTTTFGKARLLTFDRDPLTHNPTVEVAHEALIREWGRYREWLDASRMDISMQGKLAAAGDEWKFSKKDPSFLLRGARLDQIENWANNTDIALTTAELEYLTESAAGRKVELEREAARQAHEKRLEMRARKVLQGLVAVLVLGVIVSSWFAVQATNAEKEALRQASIGLAAQAVSELESASPERAVLLALEALENYPYTGQAESALAQAVEAFKPYMILFPSEVLRINASAWSPDGEKIAAVGGEGVISIWDANTTEELSVLNASNDFSNMADVAWTAQGDKIITTSKGFGIARVWDIRTGELLLSFENHRDEVNSVSVSHNGDMALTAGRDGAARLWSLKSGAEKMVLYNAAGVVMDAIWSPDEDMIYTSDLDGHIHAWNVTSGEKTISWQAHFGGVLSLATSPDGSFIASGGADGTARIWNAATGQLAETLIGHDGEVRSVDWSPDGFRIATASADGTARVWDALGGVELFSLYGLSYDLRSARWSLDGKRLAIAGGLVVTVYDLPNQSLRLVGHSGPLADAQWSPDMSLIATSGSDCTIRIWDASDGKLLTTFTNHQEAGAGDQGTHFFSWSPNGERLVSVGSDGNARVWDPLTGEQFLVLNHNAKFVWQADWSPDGRFIATGDDTGMVYVWDADTGEKITSITNGCFYLEPSWAPDSSRIVTDCIFGSLDGEMIWDALTGKALVTFTGHKETSSRSDWSPDGKKIVSGSTDNTVIIWDAETAARLFTYTGHINIIFDAEWSPDGTRIASGDESGYVHIWDASTGENVYQFQAQGGVVGVEWSPDGTYVIVSGFFPVPDIRRAWQSTDDLISYAKECCTFRELSTDEREQFGLPSTAAQKHHYQIIKAGISQMVVLIIPTGIAAAWWFKHSRGLMKK